MCGACCHCEALPAPHPPRSPHRARPRAPPRWLLEDGSTSTRANALNSLAIIAALNDAPYEPGEGGGGGGGGGDEGGGGSAAWTRIVVVTNPFHQLRAYRTFLRAMREAGMAPEAGGTRRRRRRGAAGAGVPPVCRARAVCAARRLRPPRA